MKMRFPLSTRMLRPLCDKGRQLAFLATCVSCVLCPARGLGASRLVPQAAVTPCQSCATRALWATPALMPHPRWGPRGHGETAATTRGPGPGGQRSPHPAHEETEAQRFEILHRSTGRCPAALELQDKPLAPSSGPRSQPRSQEKAPPLPPTGSDLIAWVGPGWGLGQAWVGGFESFLGDPPVGQSGCCLGGGWEGGACSSSRSQSNLPICGEARPGPHWVGVGLRRCLLG